jgi:hypothetical protein
MIPRDGRRDRRGDLRVDGMFRKPDAGQSDFGGRQSSLPLLILRAVADSVV